MFKLTPHSVIRLADGACIPVDEGNGDYRAYLEWCAEGNTPDPADIPGPPDKAHRVAALLATHGETRLTIQAALMSLETAAQVKGIPLDTLYARNKTYKVCKDMEAACIAIEKS